MLRQHHDAEDVAGARIYRITEQTLGIAYNANAACTNDATFNNHYLGSVTYIRGAHEMKAGVSFFRAESYNPQPAVRLRHVHLSRRRPGPGDALPAAGADRQLEGGYRPVGAGSLAAGPADAELRPAPGHDSHRLARTGAAAEPVHAGVSLRGARHVRRLEGPVPACRRRL